MKMKFLAAAICLFCHESFAQLAQGKCKFLGNIIANSTPVDFTTYWNQVTPENGGKWGQVEQTRDVMNWGALDNSYQTAKNNELLFRQHNFVWGQQQPAWLDALTAAEIKEEVEEWIQSYCQRYPETDFIDVVNEPLHAPPAYKDALGGNGLTGWDWLIWTFEKARQYCPDAKLFINDYNIISSTSSTTAFLQIIDLLKSRNLIDGIGEQGHFLETTPIATIESNLDRLEMTGLPVQITEFDLHFLDDTQQKTRYEELFPKLWNHSSVQGITMWGYRQGEIWRENAYLLRSNGSSRPAFTWLKSFVENSNEAGNCNPVPVGILDETRDEFAVYPNPALNGNIQVTIPSLESCNFTINDITGKTIVNVAHIDSGVHTFRISIPGTYMLRLAGPNATHYKKVIVY
jgi:endo-1,4-beta-xylanase